MDKPLNIKWCEAIIALNNSVGSITGETAADFVIDWDGKTERTQSVIEAKITELETAETSAATQKAANEVSGNAKLLGLGLTQAEATALTGYTPS